MKETALHIIIASAFGAFMPYLNILAIPLIVLITVMIADYGTGLAGAYVTGTLNSRIGIKGIVKKVGYLILVAVGMVIDYLLSTAVAQAGMDIKLTYCVGLIVTIWLIINELISILENLSEIGVKLPKFMTTIINKLKKSVDEKIE